MLTTDRKTYQDDGNGAGWSGGSLWFLELQPETQCWGTGCLPTPAKQKAAPGSVPILQICSNSLYKAASAHPTPHHHHHRRRILGVAGVRGTGWQAQSWSVTREGLLSLCYPCTPDRVCMECVDPEKVCLGRLTSGDGGGEVDLGDSERCEQRAGRWSDYR